MSTKWGHYPKYHDYDITDPSCIELIKTARDKGLPVAFTLRMVDTRLRSWMDVTKEWSIKDIIPIIKYHHERPSGKGYPGELGSGEIPRLVRVVSVADAFDAMTSDRPYREHFSLDYAISELKKYRGTQFDEGIVDIFIKDYQELKTLLAEVKRQSPVIDLNNSGFNC